MYWIVGGIAAAIFVLDYFVKDHLRLNAAFQSQPIIPNVLYLSVVFNSGAAFGLMQGKTVFLIYASAIFLLFFLLFIKYERKKSHSFYIACGLILGGASSNLFDRFVYGYVVDYLDLRIWPVFNISDSCISVGACMLLFGSLRKPREKKEIGS